MSFALARGDPYPSQLYLDGVLDEILKEKNVYNSNGERERVSLAQLLYHCLKKNPDDVFMINGTTSEVITNAQMLKLSVSLARTLIAKDAKGKTIIIVMRNHQCMVAIYLAAIFSGVQPFMMDPSCTAYEIKYFLDLIEPMFVFCDEKHYDDITISLKNLPHLTTEVLISNKEENLKSFAGQESDINNFMISDSDPHSTVLMLPTSGSTGLPKPALLTNIGLVGQIPATWAHYTQFPKPTELIMILTTCQWVTFTMMVTSSIAFNIPVLISPQVPTVEHVKEMLLRFRPTWTFFNPAFVKSLLPVTTKDHFSSLKSLTLLGSAYSMELFNELKARLPATTHLRDGYGTTETQGFIALPDKDAPGNSNGRPLNIFLYKLKDDNGDVVGLRSFGELYVKSVCCIKGYYKNESIYAETFIDGWYKTGDWFYIDENERLRFVERRKFSFKFRGCQVSPEEVEGVIDSVPGVAESVVCCTDDGPAAAVVVRNGTTVTKEQIHKAVDGALSDHKRLHGGIAFVATLPHTHTGKLNRKEARSILLSILNGECRNGH